MAINKPVVQQPNVFYHVSVQSKRGREYSDQDARDLLAANRARIAEAHGEAQLNRSFAVLADGQPVDPIIVLALPRETDPKKTQTNPSAFFAETDRVTVSWRQVTEAEDPSPLPEGVSDLGKQVDADGHVQAEVEVKLDAKG